MGFRVPGGRQTPPQLHFVHLQVHKVYLGNLQWQFCLADALAVTLCVILSTQSVTARAFSGMASLKRIFVEPRRCMNCDSGNDCVTGLALVWEHLRRLIALNQRLLHPSQRWNMRCWTLLLAAS